MTSCKHHAGRSMPISGSMDERFCRMRKDYFAVCLITQGHGVFLLNGERCYLQEHSLLCLNRHDRIELLAAWQLRAVSVSFAPEFMNVNLNWSVVAGENYPSLARQFDYPTFSLFLKRNLLYNGILPLNPSLSQIVKDTLGRINHQRSAQPDGMWSCRSRTNLFELFEIAAHFCGEFMEGVPGNDDLAGAVLQEIHLNLCSPFTLASICEKYHTNHTTLNRHFKRLTGCTVTDYILEKRILLAKYALAFTELSVTEIADKYAFYDPTYFIKTFKKRVGTTPVKYRKEARAARPKKPSKHTALYEPPAQIPAE